MGFFNDTINEGLNLDSKEFAKVFADIIRELVRQELNNLGYDYKIPCVITSLPVKSDRTYVVGISISDGSGTYNVINTAKITKTNMSVVAVGDLCYATAINGDSKNLLITDIIST